MKDWIKKQLEMTPRRRLGVSYWIATFQAILMMTFFQDLSAETPMAHWSIFLISWLFIGYLYIKNTMAFEKETLWMTIKNPAKVTITEDEVWGRQVHPIRPPPPPKPPVPHHKRTYKNGPSWPPKAP